LFKKIFEDDVYNSEVRPFGQDDLTKVETELKLLQIDLDEKYQQLVIFFSSLYKLNILLIIEI
jgi:hypothetical protein